MRLSTENFYTEAVQRAVKVIADGLDRAVELEALAKIACLSPFHFHRIFKGMIGETPLELHRRLRLERSAIQLSETDRSVSEIAFIAGYETHEAFTRAFTENYGLAPSAFRKSDSQALATCA